MPYPIHGDGRNPGHARHALPILVRQAHAQRPITYSDLAEEIGTHHRPMSGNHGILEIIGQTIDALNKQNLLEKIPHIQALVVNKETGLPGSGLHGFPGWQRKSLKEKKKLHSRHLREVVFAYERWTDVLDELDLTNPFVGTSDPPIRHPATTARGGGESKQHRRLKKHVAKSPTKVGLPVQCPNGKTEFLLPSGDSVDVMFSWKDQIVVVEVKSRKSNEQDICRGLFQCVKYEAVARAMLDVRGKPQNVRACLVLEEDLPKGLMSVKNVLGVDVKKVHV